MSPVGIILIVVAVLVVLGAAGVGLIVWRFFYQLDRYPEGREDD